MNEITYRTVRSKRRTTAIQICPDGTVLVRCPRSVPDSRIKELVKEKENWIHQKLASQPTAQNAMSREQVRQLADKARQYLPSRVAIYALQMGVTYGRISRENSNRNSLSADLFAAFCFLFLALR